MTTGIPGRYLPGRPAYYAVLSLTPDYVIGILDAFFKITAKLSYREMIGLSRSLDISYSAILRWKYHLSRPDFQVMMVVIEWAKAGKPLIRKRRQINFSLL
jgi:hypothetical protein